MYSFLMIVTGYLIGSISFAVVMSRIFALPDPRTYGSGNPGATNVLRSGKKIAALLTLVGDAGKGIVAVWLARKCALSLGLDTTVVAGVALAAFLGHLYPVFHRFHGGKGVATAAGIFVALHWPFGLALIGVWAGVFALSKVSSLSALAAAASAVPLACYFFGWSVPTALVGAISALLIWRHRSNIALLLAGREKPIAASEDQRS
jgi:glycerol-3-phosphate acyltransferase PlsY